MRSQKAVRGAGRSKVFGEFQVVGRHERLDPLVGVGQRPLRNQLAEGSQCGDWKVRGGVDVIVGVRGLVDDRDLLKVQTRNRVANPGKDESHAETPCLRNERHALLVRKHAIDDPAVGVVERLSDAAGLIHPRVEPQPLGDIGDRHGEAHAAVGCRRPDRDAVVNVLASRRINVDGRNVVDRLVIGPSRFRNDGKGIPAQGRVGVVNGLALGGHVAALPDDGHEGAPGHARVLFRGNDSGDNRQDVLALVLGGGSHGHLGKVTIQGRKEVHGNFAGGHSVERAVRQLQNSGDLHSVC